MKKILILCALIVGASSIAQDVEPKYEIEGNLVKATYYHNNGKIKQEGFYKDGKVHGKWISYSESGEKLSLGEFNNGQKYGKWFFWKDGSLNEVDYAESRIAAVSKWEKETIAYRK